MAMTNSERIDGAVAAWMAAKIRISDSEMTPIAYGHVINHFRARLQAQGKDLDPAAWVDRHNEDEWRLAMAQLVAEVEAFASTYLHSSKPTGAATYTQRISILSSFYAFAIGAWFPAYANPIDRVQRKKVKSYGKVFALSFIDVQKAMEGIDRTTLEGLRDHVLLSIFLETGRRRSEVQRLRWGDVELPRKLDAIAKIEDIQLALRFGRIKGGDTARHEISHIVSVTLLQWLARCYSVNPLYLDPARPLFVNLRNFGFVAEHEQLSRNGVARICQKRLGVSPHKLRHTTAQFCYEAGMPLTDIAQLLGHSNLGTLMTYLEALAPKGKNSKLAQLDAAFGIQLPVPAPLPLS